MVQCKNCGAQVAGKFCTSCGTPIDQPEDAGSTTVLRPEDLQAYYDQQAQQQAGQAPAAGTPPQGATPAWSSEQPAQNQPAQNQPPQDQQGGWGQPAAGQQPAWGQSEAQPQQPAWGQADQQAQQSGWEQQTPPQQSGGSQDQQGGSAWGQQQNQQGFGQQLGGGFTSVDTSTGGLISGAMSVIQNHMVEVLVVAAAYAVLEGVSQIAGNLGGIGLLLSFLIGLVAAPFLQAGGIYITAGSSGDPVGLLTRILPVIPMLVLLYFISVVMCIIGLIGIIIGALVVAFFLQFGPQAVVLGGQNAFSAIGTSFSNVPKAVGPLLVGVGLLILGVIVLAILSAILGHIPVIGALVSSFIGGVFLLYYIAYVTLAYMGVTGTQGVPAATGASPAAYAGP